MKRKGFAIQCWLLTLAVGLFWVVLAGAQSQNMPVQGSDPDLTRQQLAGFDRFLDSHPEIAEQLRNNPSLVNNEEFVENHADLQQYLQAHPEVRQDLSQNPNAVLHQEQRYDRREDQQRDQGRDGDTTRGELSNMDRFMDSHPEIAEQLRRNPSLVNNKEFIEDHPALQQFLASHPELREEYRENPQAFMHQEQRFDRRQDTPDRDVTRGELSNMDRFMDSHPEIAEQLRKNPSLINNKDFTEDHPALQQFLTNHPELREEYKENPQAFMRQENNFDRREGSGDRNNREVSSFGEFLGSHGNIAGEVSNNPSLATNKEYLENHPELRDYLKNNPKVQEGLNKDPQAFVKQAQQMGTMRSPKSTTIMPKTADPKLK